MSTARRRGHSWGWGAIALLAGAVLAAAPLRADDPSRALAADRGVRVEKPAGDGRHYSQGSGVYLGDGLILTAAHVVTINPAIHGVTIILDGRRVDADLIVDGQADKLDLAIIRVAQPNLPHQRQRQPAVAVCPNNPPPRQPVVVASEGKVTATATIDSAITTTDGDTGTWTDLLATGFHQGNSGGGVFDPKRGCLWGILTMELSGRAKSSGRLLDLTAFIPASRIDAFLKRHAGDIAAAR